MGKLSDTSKSQLLDIAHQSIESGVNIARPLSIHLDDYSDELSAEHASFVTLHLNQQLRGCIGSLQAYRPLAIDVAENAFSAAFRDPRFPPVTQNEVAKLHFHISVLSQTSPISFENENDLLEQIRPNVDGLVIEDGFNRGTFLPSVWEQLPSKEAFLSHLKQKAGLPSDYWSPNIKVERYTVEDVEEAT